MGSRRFSGAMAYEAVRRPLAVAAFTAGCGVAATNQAANGDVDVTNTATVGVTAVVTAPSDKRYDPAGMASVNR